MKGVFCPLPWTIISAQPSGIMRVCSPSHSTMDRGVLRKSDGSLHKLGESNISEAKNCDLLKKVRSNMLSGKETPEVCMRCIKDEKSGVPSRRTIENSKNFFTFDKAKKITNIDGSININCTTTIDLRFGNKCNLSCRMCSPAASSAWYNEYYETRHKRFTDGDQKHELVRNDKNQIVLKNDIYNWILNPFAWNDLLTHINNVRELHFSGGEPFLILEHYDLLEKIIELKKAHEISLDYNSNITILPKRLLKIWKSFKSVTLAASVDAVGALNDYIRYPSIFSKIEFNLETLDTTTFKNTYVWISTTLQVLNVFAITDLYQWLLKKKFKKMNYHFSNNEKRMLLFTHILHSPAHLSIKILPIEFKVEIEKKFELLKIWLQQFLKENSEMSIHQKDELTQMISEHLNSVVKFMYSEDHSSLFPQFWEEMKISDQFRKQNIEDIIPELARVMRSIDRKNSEDNTLNSKNSSN